jgi:predicted nuclease with TOPRIM domain
MSDQNRQLLKENASLRGQFDDAIHLASQIDAVTDKNIRLGNELRDAASRNSELEDRLQILSKAKTDLERRLARQEQAFISAQQHDCATWERKLRKQEHRYRAEIERLSGDLQSSNESQEELAIKFQKQEVTLKSIVGNASRYFGMSFADADDFAAWLTQASSLQDTILEECPKTTLFIKMEENLAESHREKQEMLHKHEEMVTELSRQLEKNENAISEYRRGLAQLEGELARKQEEKTALEKENDGLVMHLRDIQDRARNLSVENEKMQAQFTACEASRAKLQSVFSNLERQYESVSEELVSLRSAQLVDSRERAGIERKLEGATLYLRESEATIDSQRVQIQDLTKIAAENTSQKEEVWDWKRRLERNLARFLSNLSLSLSIQSISVEEFNTPRGIDSVSQQLANYCARAEAFRDRAKSLDAVIAHFHHAFDADPSRDTGELMQIISEAKARIVQLESRERDLMRVLDRVAELESSEREALMQLDQLRRENSLAKAEAKNTVVAAESDFHDKLQKQKIALQADKRRIFAFVIDQFRQFFNPQSLLEEEACYAIIRRARDEIVRLTQSDQTVRRLIGAEPSQRTEDAVAQLIR